MVEKNYKVIKEFVVKNYNLVKEVYNSEPFNLPLKGKTKELVVIAKKQLRCFSNTREIDIWRKLYPIYSQIERGV